MHAGASYRIGLLAATIGSLLLTACIERPPAQEANAPAPVNAAAPDPAPKQLLPAPEAPLSREALLLAVVRARSAAAAGIDDRARQAELDGARFEFRIRLGCRFQAEGEEPGSRPARLDEEQRRVELSAAPDLALDHPIVAALAGDGFEAAEGFWIASPWLLVPACAAPAAGEPGVGIAQFFTAADPRTARRDGRSYVTRESWAEGSAPPAPGSWDLVLTGRLRQQGGGRTIFCRSVTEGTPPACIISAEFEQVTIVNNVTGEQLAEWGRG